MCVCAEDLEQKSALSALIGSGIIYDSKPSENCLIKNLRCLINVDMRIPRAWDVNLPLMCS